MHAYGQTLEEFYVEFDQFLDLGELREMRHRRLLLLELIARQLNEVLVRDRHHLRDLVDRAGPRPRGRQ